MKALWQLGRWVLLGMALCMNSAVYARTPISLDEGWRFIRDDVKGAQAPQFDATIWPSVNLPHTFNIADGGNGGGYYRGPVWYRKVIQFKPSAREPHTFIEFDGAAVATEVWVNGASVGRHEGGYARFRFDLTPYLKAGENVLAVKVDNAKTPGIAPLDGDFTLFGGLYRSVRLIRTSGVHFDLLDYGGPGVYVQPSAVSEARADIGWTARIANDTDTSKTVIVVARLKDAQRKVVREVRAPATVAPRSTRNVDLATVVDLPHLWQGVDDPYLYTSDVVLMDGADTSQELDRLATKVGLRDIQMDADKGIFLNGKPYKVHGVNIHHAMRPGHGPAVGDGAVDADFQMLQEMGVTGLRLAHYQHQQRDYDLSDEKGFLVWTEIPMVGQVNGTDAFAANVTQQLHELIQQNRNHASVMVWGLGNEIYKDDEPSNALLAVLDKVANAQDPSRPTTYAHCCGAPNAPHTTHTDVIAYNIYFGWYDGQFGDYAGWGTKTQGLAGKPMAISEYGAGASIHHQEDPPRRPVPASRWHPEQWQSLYHEAAWRQIRDMPFTWSSFLWVGFDFPSDGRNEGDHEGFNDKGLITYDRLVKKDAYFWYQANWTTKPMLYITSRRNNVRGDETVELKVYSNGDRVRLTLNDIDEGERAVTDHIATWRLILNPGHNRIVASAVGGLSDSVDWILAPPAVPSQSGPDR